MFKRITIILSLVVVALLFGVLKLLTASTASGAPVLAVYLSMQGHVLSQTLAPWFTGFFVASLAIGIIVSIMRSCEDEDDKRGNIPIQHRWMMVSFSSAVMFGVMALTSVLVPSPETVKAMFGVATLPERQMVPADGQEIIMNNVRFVLK